MKKAIIFSLTAIYLLSLPFWIGGVGYTEAAFTGTLSFANPGSGGSVEADPTHAFTINMALNTAGQNSTGADVLVTFDNIKLDFDAANSSVANLYPNNHYLQLHATGSNQIDMGASYSGGTNYINTTSASTFATLSFKPKTTPPAGGTQVIFGFVFSGQGNTTDSNIVSTDVNAPDLLGSVSSATITINAYVPPVANPSIVSISPNQVNEGTTETDVTLTASTDTTKQFGGTKGTVNFDGTALAAAKVTSWSITTIHFLAPARTVTADDPTDVYIVTAETTPRTSNTVTFTYKDVSAVANPSIVSISPNQVNEGTTETDVTLTASTDTTKQFGGTKGTVNFDGTALAAAKVTSWSVTTIHFLAPAKTVTADTTVNVYIVTAETTPRTSNTVTFTYKDVSAVNDPYISYLSPPSGLANADVPVTIVGGNFGATAGTGTVKFGQLTAVFSSWTDTRILVTAPKLGEIYASYICEVVVTRADGKTAKDYYTYLAPTSTGGTTTTPTGMPMSAWAGLISANGALAILVKRKFF